MDPNENTGSVNDITGTELPILEEPTVTEEPVVTEPAVVEEPVPTGPVYVTTLDELVATHGAIVQREDADKSLLLSVFQPNPTTLKTQLIVWASLGFVPDWPVFRTQINPPPVCSDGQTRLFYDYITYLLASPIDSFLAKLNSQVPGLTFNLFRYDAITIGLSVSKAGIGSTGES